MTTWRQIIDEAKARGTFPKSAKLKAGSWGSCAVAEKLDLHEAGAVFEAAEQRTDTFELLNLGNQFCRDVYDDDDPYAADQTYKAIMAL